ncbi:acetyl-CoA carboxylase biotin carboxyl carrier protein [Metabacillus sp. RGM 3146]|uniref:acetyl-CoA carboxylase biotin carboxyl carrier protein n=1 Tax=Metabacillus sp. RGM 3146 TaxID=3401092 RepID=UPI003B9BF9F0
MLKIQEIRELIKLIDQSSIDEFTYENEGSKLSLKKGADLSAAQANLLTQKPAETIVQSAHPQAAPAAPKESEKQHEAKEEPSEKENTVKITSPMVGTFYASSSPDTDVYVSRGSKVKEDSVVCIVEAMKLFNEIEAEVKGEIVEVLVENGQLVEYGQPLFLVKPE